MSSTYKTAPSCDLEHMQIDSEADYVYIEHAHSASKQPIAKSIPIRSEPEIGRPPATTKMRRDLAHESLTGETMRHAPARQTAPATRMQREPEGLSAEAMVSWQEALLKDPKNR